MKIVICSSLDFTFKIKEVEDKLKEIGHEVVIPRTSRDILEGLVSLDQIKKEKTNGDIVKRAQSKGVIRFYFNEIKNADAVLVLNLDKKGIKNYIGGNVFLEMGFAHVLNKKIFLFNDIPDIHYKDEIRIMEPKIIDGDLNKIN